ncbi:MAG: hypothetical protein Q8M69_13375 [Reyranella sp.]|nr:hypothetical protein [Reyranella sp.]
MIRSGGEVENGSDRLVALLPKLCIALIVVLTVGYTVAGAIVRPNMYSDSGWGFVGWYTQDRASAFNNALGLDYANISAEVEGFMTTWTPGQHVLPGLVEKLGMSLGLAIIVVVAIFTVLGLFGWFTLYRAFGFSLQTTSVAVAIVACTRFYNLPFTNYTGGEVLLFGVAPWFVLMAWKLRDLRWFAVLPLLAGTAVMVFAKLNGIIIAAAVVGGAAICGDDAWRRRDTVRKLVVAGVTIGLMGAIFYVSWYTRGATAASISTEIHRDGLLFYISFGVGSLWSSALSLLDLSNYLFLNPGRQILQSGDAIAYTFFPLALATYTITWMRLRHAYGEYLRFTYSISAATLAFLLLMWLTGASISFEERHFRIPSLLLFVGVVQVFTASRSWLMRISFAAVAGLACLYGVTSFVTRTIANSHYAMGDRGFRQINASAEAVAFIRTIDLAGPDAKKTLIFLPSPEIALEVRNARSSSNHADFEPLEALKSQVYHGRVDRLYVFVQKRLLSNGKADAILRSFVDYPIDGWTMVPLGDLVCFYQVRR